MVVPFRQGDGPARHSIHELLAGGRRLHGFHGSYRTPHLLGDFWWQRPCKKGVRVCTSADGGG